MDIKEQEKLAKTISVDEALDFVNTNSVNNVKGSDIVGTYSWKTKKMNIEYGILLKDKDNHRKDSFGTFDFTSNFQTDFNNVFKGKWFVVQDIVNEENGYKWIQKFA